MTRRWGTSRCVPADPAQTGTKERTPVPSVLDNAIADCPETAPDLNRHTGAVAVIDLPR